MGAPIPSMTDHRALGGASTTVERSSTSTHEPPDHAGSRAAGRTGDPGELASRPTPGGDLSGLHPGQGEPDGVVEWHQAARRVGDPCAMSCSEHTDSFRSDSTRGRAIDPGTGVTTSTHRLDRRGVRRGTGTIHQRGPAAA